MRRFFGLTALLPASLGCGGSAFDGFIEVRGAWADGEPIAFRHGAVLSRVADRLHLSAVDVDRRPRFMGLRVAIDPARIKAPGLYQVEAATDGQLQVWVDRPLLERDVKEYLVNRSALEIRTLPAADGTGTLDIRLVSARLQRMDNGDYLTLTGGELYGER